MKMDMELIRKILVAIEEKSNGTWIANLKIDGYKPIEVAYHCNLLYEGGYVCDCKIQYGDDDDVYFFGVGHLTWNGHEFLDEIRNDTVWNKTKETIINKGLPMVIDVVKAVASSVTSILVKSALGMP